jgi:hypothetical protein
MQRTITSNLLFVISIGVVFAWTVTVATPVFGQRYGRGESRGSMSSRSVGASTSRGVGGGSATTSRSSFNSSGRSLGSAGGIGGSTRNLTPSLKNPAPRSRTIVPEIRKPAAQSKTIVPNLRNLPTASKRLTSNDRNSTPDYRTAPSRRIVLPPRGKEQPAIHATHPSLTEKRSVDSKSYSSNFRVSPLRENVVSRNDVLSTRPDPASNRRDRSAEWNAVSARIKSLSAAQNQTPPNSTVVSPPSRTVPPVARNVPADTTNRLPDRRVPSAGHANIPAHVRSILADRGITLPNSSVATPPNRTEPPTPRNVPGDDTERSPRREVPSANGGNIPSHVKRILADRGITLPGDRTVPSTTRGITPYRSLFKPRTSPPVHDTDDPRDDTTSHDRAKHRGGHAGGSLHHGPHHSGVDHRGVDHRGPPHGTPRHDYRLHGKLDRHSLYPGHYYYGHHGYGYRGSSFSIYLGSPLYSSNSYYYDEPYYGVPYYMPYAVPVPVPYVVETDVVETDVVETDVVETDVVEPTAPVSVTVQNGAVIPAVGAAAEFQLQAEQAFQQQRYEDAARLSNHAIVEDSQNGKLHLFASQAFFALGDYPSAAAAVQQSASLLDSSEWGFVVENYQEFYRSDDYVTQMAELDKYIEENPKASYAYFLRGYHFLFLGHKEAAQDNLAKAVELESRDVLAAELLKMAGGQVPNAALEQPANPEG